MKKIFITAIIAITATIAAVAQSNTQALIPYPNKIELCNKGKAFTISTSTTISTTLPADAFVIGELQRITQKRLGLTPAIASGKHSKNIIALHVDSTLKGREHYT